MGCVKTEPLEGNEAPLVNLVTYFTFSSSPLSRHYDLFPYTLDHVP